jgi:hypothetical protein
MKILLDNNKNDQLLKAIAHCIPHFADNRISVVMVFQSQPSCSHKILNHEIILPALVLPSPSFTQ